MARTGRPSSLTPEIAAAVVDVLAGGNFRQVAAKAAGVSPSTLQRWIARGAREESGIYHDFRLAVLKAEQDAEVEAVRKIIHAGSEDPKHLQWWLERRWPERWSRDRLELKAMNKALKDLEARLAVLDGASTR